MTETIVISPLSVLLPGQTFVTEKNCASLQLNYQPVGGSFSISVLKDSTVLPPEDFVITLPFGRVGVVRNTGGNRSSGGLLDTIAGPMQPLSTALQTFLGIPGGTNRLASQIVVQLANGGSVFWSTLDVLVKNFIFRGIAISGIQQIAQIMLADVIVRANGIYIIDPGSVVGNTPFTVQKADIISAQQNVDYNLDIAAVLNPALTSVQVNDEGNFVYDGEHAQKQGKFTVQSGAPGSEASKDFIPIPDGWLVDGNYEEWTPPSGTDFTNPSASVPQGRYWKVLQSPTNPALLRGITNFTRLVKEIKIPGNVSTFIGSPVTGLTKRNTSREYSFNAPGTESGITGFTADDTTLFDVISHQFFTFTNAIVLIPGGGGSSGAASSNFYSITMELWTFPRVAPTVFPVGGPDPTNPFNLPKNVAIVNPSSNVVFFDSFLLQQYWNHYLNNYRRINSPRLRTQISVVFRNYMPQVGDQLVVVSGLNVSNCGRIQSVTFNFGRGGLILNITAEIYNYGSGGKAQRFVIG